MNETNDMTLLFNTEAKFNDDDRACFNYDNDPSRPVYDPKCYTHVSLRNGERSLYYRTVANVCLSAHLIEKIIILRTGRRDGDCS